MLSLSIKLYFLVVFINLFNEINSEPITYAPIVNTTAGKVRGIVKDLDDGTQFYLYEGIPYAEPPLGNLRFSKPVPKSSWTGVYDAVKYRNTCIQPDNLQPDNNIPEESVHSEDCLFLTVWAPKDPLPDGKKRSVLYWFYGGGFETGTIFSVANDVRYLAVLGDVVVVTVNYRLGPWGFMYAGTEDAAGNMGLYDQLLGLKWVNKNIDRFGGDPKSITIFGESAGGMSVGAHVLSPLSHGLYRRAIMQSGAPNSYLGSESKEKGYAKTLHLATKLNCSTASGADIVACLKLKTTDQILNISKIARLDSATFEPIWGEELLPIDPKLALQNGDFNKEIDLMFGTVSEEGALFVEALFRDKLNPDIVNPPINVTISHQIIQFMYMAFKESMQMGGVVADFYLKGLKDNDFDKLRQAIGYGFGDYHLTCPTVLFGQEFARHSTGNKVYAFRQTFPPAIPVFPECRGWMGVCHGDDVMMLFGFPLKLKGITFTENDAKLSLDMIKTWSTFARTGSPPQLGADKWEEAVDRKVADSHVKYMDLNPKSNYPLVTDYYKESCEDFWAKTWGYKK